MRHTTPRGRTALLTIALTSAALTSFGRAVEAQARTEAGRPGVARPDVARPDVAPSDSGASPENLTSSRDGTVYFGSMATGTIYRAAPGATRAAPWILASAAGLTRVLGVLADDRSHTLWVCQNATDGRGGAPVTGQTALRAFNLGRAAAKGTYPLPPNAGVCNDIAISANGTAYVSESFRGRVHRLRPGGSALEVWASDSAIAVIDGLAVLADGVLYVNTINTGRLYRIPVKASTSPRRSLCRTARIKREP